jgi:Fur family transcriptional regulator, ferric uptake regulator
MSVKDRHSTDKTLNEILQRLREAGQRLTIQRRVVVEALAYGNAHMTICDIQDYIAGRNVVLDKSTIYRILEKLNEVGVVSQTDLGTHGVVYELMRDTPHHHLVCLSCGDISNLADTMISPLRAQLEQTYGFLPRLDHMALFGYCQQCQQEGAVATQKPCETTAQEHSVGTADS